MTYATCTPSTASSPSTMTKQCMTNSRSEERSVVHAHNLPNSHNSKLKLVLCLQQRPKLTYRQGSSNTTPRLPPPPSIPGIELIRCSSPCSGTEVQSVGTRRRNNCTYSFVPRPQYSIYLANNPVCWQIPRILTLNDLALYDRKI